MALSAAGLGEDGARMTTKVLRRTTVDGRKTDHGPRTPPLQALKEDTASGDGCAAEHRGLHLGQHTLNDGQPLDTGRDYYWRLQNKVKAELQKHKRLKSRRDAAPDRRANARKPPLSQLDLLANLAGKDMVYSSDQPAGSMGDTTQLSTVQVVPTESHTQQASLSVSQFDLVCKSSSLDDGRPTLAREARSSVLGETYESARDGDVCQRQPRIVQNNCYFSAELPSVQCEENAVDQSMQGRCFDNPLAHQGTSLQTERQGTGNMTMEKSFHRLLAGMEAVPLSHPSSNPHLPVSGRRPEFKHPTRVATSNKTYQTMHTDPNYTLQTSTESQGMGGTEV